MKFQYGDSTGANIDDQWSWRMEHANTLWDYTKDSARCSIL